MPQLVNKRRSRLAVLVVSALVASMLAVTGASPVVATEQQADAQATWKACLGEALVSRDFSDVGMDSVHYDDINCLAYYGITTGTTADTYDPGGHVTRWQMALFLTRAAKAADIDLGDAMDMGFTDLGTVGADGGVMAINTLASNEIMSGRTATTFDPAGLVTRADMAVHLFKLLDLGLDSIHIDTLRSALDGDGTGAETRVGDLDVNNGMGLRPDDYFGDVRRTQPAHIDDMINAVYELGITKGTNGMTGDSGTFAPARPVTRAQMASFIMRAMNHTNLRPAGLTAQQTVSQTQVSVRDADFAPVANQRVEVIRSTYAADAFDNSGGCIDRYVNGLTAVLGIGFGKCGIDVGDDLTDATGNVILGAGSGSATGLSCTTAGTAPIGVVSAMSYSIETPGGTDADVDSRMWAWTGDLGDKVNSGTELYEVESAYSRTTRTPAVAAILTGGTAYTFRMGQTLTYTLQLVDSDGKPTGPNPGADHSFTVTTVKAEAGRTDISAGEAAALSAIPAGITGGTALSSNVPQTMTPNRSGKITITVQVPDPNPAPIYTDSASVVHNNAAPVHAAIRVQRGANNNLALVDMTTNGGTSYRATATDEVFAIDADGVIFDDDNSAADSVSATSASLRLFVPGGVNRNSVVVTVRDQYGNPYRGTGLYAQVQPYSADPAPGSAGVLGAAVVGGTARISYPVAGATNPTIGSARIEAIAIYDAATEGTASNAIDGSTPLAVTGDDRPLVHWARRGMTANNGVAAIAIDLIDVGGRQIVVAETVGGTAGPSAYLFGDDDSFMVEGTAVTMAQFQEILKVASDSSDPRISTRGSLEWSGLNFNRPRDGATWTLTGLTCSKRTYG